MSLYKLGIEKDKIKVLLNDYQERLQYLKAENARLFSDNVELIKKLEEAERKTKIAHDIIKSGSHGRYVRGVFMSNKEAYVIARLDYEQRVKTLEELEEENLLLIQNNADLMAEKRSNIPLEAKLERAVEALKVCQRDYNSMIRMLSGLDNIAVRECLDRMNLRKAMFLKTLDELEEKGE